MILDDLKSSKVKGHDSIYYDLIKNATSLSFKHLLLDFFNQLLSTNTIPKNFNISIIKPILKDPDKKSDDTNNIRPLSISNCLSQIFEKLILYSSPKLREIHKNQFGFKPKTSCNHAVFTMKETILHYVENGSGVRIASLDAEKAFDKVWRDGLFFKLIDELDLSIWVLLKKYYDSSKGTIFDPFLDLFSELFIIETGVKQGGIFSPYLFNKFINGLIESIHKLDIGAHVGNLNVSIIVYADDILLISPCALHLQMLLNECTSFGMAWRLKFNPSKSNIIEFGQLVIPDVSFELSNGILNVADEITYLGVKINKDLNFDYLTCEKFKNVQKSIFSLSYLGLKPNMISPFLQAFIYKTYCLSQFTYGLETSTLTRKSREFLNISQNNLIRQIVGLSFSCHISKIFKCLRLYNFHDLYLKAKLSFIDTLKNNELSCKIFLLLCENKDKISPRSKSFKKDINLLESHYNNDILIIKEDAYKLSKKFYKNFRSSDGITDSIRTCLENIKNKKYKIALDDLIKPEFIKEDEEFQELLQYLIITNNDF